MEKKILEIEECFNEILDYKKIIRQNIIIQILLFIILLVIDRLTKYWAVQVLKAKTSIVLIPNILEFRYLENKGAAFPAESAMAFLYHNGNRAGRYCLFLDPYYPSFQKLYNNRTRKIP